MDKRILIADDDPITRLMLATLLGEWDWQVVEAKDGDEALAILRSDNAPAICIVDWVMPGRDGVEVCRTIREEFPSQALYCILLTVKSKREDMLAALRAGADDFVSKPFDYEELRVRLEVGSRVVGLEESLQERAEELQKALNQVRTLRDLLPICANCRKVRDDEGYWSQVESYISKHLDVKFTHGLCPTCAKELYPEFPEEENEGT